MGRVLFVDDEKTVCRTLAVIFEGRGYEVRVAYSAEEALMLTTEWVPNSAILDVGLPQMNGVELAIRLRRLYPECQILLFSGRPETEDLVNEAAKTGERFEVVAKPIHPEFLLKWADKHLTA